MNNYVGRIVIILLSIVVVGVVGYWAIEGWNVIDSLYMTIITLTTIGYGEVHQLDFQGKLFTMLLVVFGVAGVGYSARLLGQVVVEGQLQKYLGRRIMEKSIKKLSDHFIVCGFGRVGRTVCDELSRNSVAFVVIEKEPDLGADMERAGYAYIGGNCDDDDMLRAAGIERAKGLISTLAVEADAVYVTLSARQLNPDLFIMARADSTSAQAKLLRAGATRVISPHVSAGQRMVEVTLRPSVVDFMTVASGASGEGLRIEEIAIKNESKLIGVSLKDSGIRSRYGVTVIGTRKKKGDIIYNPPPELVIEAGDTLVLMGSRAQLEQLEKAPSI